MDVGKNNNVKGPEKGSGKPRFYKGREYYRPIIDASSTPCFGVDDVAYCFARQLDKIAESENESVKMLGIFGPWGRGKTYFFKRLKKQLTERESPVSYRVVEFNAWKYQETPALWAYLYETIYGSASWREKLRLLLSRVRSWDFALFWLILFAVWIFGGLVLPWDVLPVSFPRNVGFPCSTLYVFAGFVHIVREKPLTAYRVVKRYIKRTGYKEHLGIQNEIEKDLERLLYVMVRKPVKSHVLLYVDDIDRCSTSRMNNLIDSLRTILENKEIQKRLIVICSLDEERFMQAYESRLWSNGYYSNAHRSPREHLDKLFLFGIKLAPLDSEQLKDYLQMLVKDSCSDKGHVQSDNNDVYSGTPYSEHRVENSFVVMPAKEKVPALTDTELTNLIGNFLQRNDVKGLTPRKIRIMYYQLMFASSLVAKGGGNLMDENIEAMLRKSAGLPYDIDVEKSMSDIVDMTVPY